MTVATDEVYRSRELDTSLFLAIPAYANRRVLEVELDASPTTRNLTSHKKNTSESETSEQARAECMIMDGVRLFGKNEISVES